MTKWKCYVNKKTKVVHGRKRNDACRMSELKRKNVQRFLSVSAALEADPKNRLCRVEWQNGVVDK